jgi:hypothetical protein
MKKIPLGHGVFSVIDDDDFSSVSKLKWYLGHGYAVRNKNGKSGHRFMHRMIMGAPDGIFVDHIDGDRLNNQKSNLRLATKAENGFNRPMQKRNRLGYKGVSFSKQKGKFRASIQAFGKWSHLGYFLTAEEAHTSRLQAEIKQHGEFSYGLARKNF